MHATIESRKENTKCQLFIRMARAGTKKRPVYHIVVADSRFPRDGRFIERLGFFNPLLPKDHKDRLRLDLDKVKAWIAKGAQPSDRVMRFLDAAGVAKRETRNNPEKAVPRKERKAQAEADAKAALLRQARGCGAGRKLTTLSRGGALAERERICVARLGAAHGVRGEVRLWSFTADPAAVADYGPFETADGRVIEIETLRPAKDFFVARLKGIADRDAAERAAQRRAVRPARRGCRRPPTADEFYHADLIGLAVVDAAGAALGTVRGAA